MFHGEWVMDDEMDDAVNSLVYRTEQTKKTKNELKINRWARRIRPVQSHDPRRYQDHEVPEVVY